MTAKEIGHILLNSGGRRIILAEALLLTLAFHAILLFLFKTPSSNGVKQKDRKKTVAMFTLDSKKSSSYGNLMDWMEYGDPTLLVKPDEKYGFCALVKKVSFKVPVKPENELLEKFRGMETSQEAGPYKELKYEKNYCFTASHFMEKAAAKPLPLKNAPSILYPKIKNSVGIEQKNISLAGLADKDKIPSVKPGEKTVITVSSMNNGLVPRIRIDESCGVSSLDRAAASLLLKKMVSAAPVGNGEGMSDTVFQIEWNGGIKER